MSSKWAWFMFGSFVGSLAAVILSGMLALLCSRSIIKWIVGRFTKRLMSNPYESNIWEIVTAMTRISPITVVENSIRAASGAVIERPFGSPRKFLHFDGLVFSPAQLSTLPTKQDVEIDTTTVIGPKAQKPLVLRIPILAAGMGYGVGLSEKAKIAIAKGTAKAGTSTNTGEGGFLPEERQNAKHLIIQYNSGHWSKSPEILKQADAIEIRLGQGALAGTASVLQAADLEGRASEIMQVQNEEITVIPSRHKDISSPQDLKQVVERLRQLTGGVPIGVKICASAVLEHDLEIAIQAGVDFISLDGGQAGTKGGAPILEDDFGLPTIYALSRAVRYLRKRGVKDSISLLTGGAYSQPGECLKAIALGATGVYMGSSLLWAMTHDQVTKAVPWEPPTQLAWYTGSMQERFNEEEAAVYLENFLNSFTDEMKLAISALGKRSLREVNSDDMVALDAWTSHVTKVRLAYEPWEKPEANPHG